MHCMLLAKEKSQQQHEENAECQIMEKWRVGDWKEWDKTERKENMSKKSEEALYEKNRELR